MRLIKIHKVCLHYYSRNNGFSCANLLPTKITTASGRALPAMLNTKC